MQPTSNQLVYEERPTGLCLVFNHTKRNNVNMQDVSRIHDVSRVTVVTDVQPLSTGARLQLANPGCGPPSCILIIHITELIRQPQPESGY